MKSSLEICKFSLLKKILKLYKFRFIFLSILIFTLLIFLISPPWKILSWDEVDYFNASLLGIKENYIESSSLGIRHFISIILWKLGISLSPELPSNYIESNDIFLMRHFHPPLLQYVTFYFPFIKTSDFRLTALTVFIGRYSLGIILLLSCIYCNSKIFGSKLKSSYNIASVSIYIFSSVLLSENLQSHVLMAISLLFVSLTLTRLIDNKTNRKNLFINSFALTICIHSIETSIVVLIISSIIYLILGLRKGILLKTLINQISIYFVFIPLLLAFVFWPASFLKLSLFKTFALYSYRIFFIKSEYSNVFTIDTIKQIILPLLPLIIAIFYIVYLKLFHKENNAKSINNNGFIITTTIGLVYTIFMLPFSLNITYLIPGLLVLSLPLNSTLEAANISLGKLNSVLLIAFISVYISLFINLSKESTKLDSYLGNQSLGVIRDKLENKKNLEIYADGGHIFRLYLPSFAERINSIFVMNEKTKSDQIIQKIFTRENNKYKEISFNSIKHPSLIIVRNDYKRAIESLNYTCFPIDIEQLNGSACIVD